MTETRLFAVSTNVLSRGPGGPVCRGFRTFRVLRGLFCPIELERNGIIVGLLMDPVRVPRQKVPHTDSDLKALKAKIKSAK